MKYKNIKSTESDIVFKTSLYFIFCINFWLC
jgi:hypothetical protein